MKKNILLLSFSFLAGVSTWAAETSRPVPPRFSVAHLDRSIDPKADFAGFAYGSWLKSTVIPADKSRWSGFDELAQFNWAALRGILEETSEKTHALGTVEQKVGDFYASAIDQEAINKAGLSPLLSDLAKIEAIGSLNDLAQVVAYLHDRGFSAFFSVSVGTDQKNSTLNALYARQGGMSLPSKDYYFSDSFEKQRVAFVEHVGRMLILAGRSPEEAAQQAAVVFAIEKELAAGAKTPVELRDRVANYNKVSAEAFAAMVPRFPLRDYLTARGFVGSSAAEVIVGQPLFFAGLEKVLGERPISDWKAYLYYKTLADAAPALAEAFEQEHFKFYSTVLRGTPAMEPRWQRAARFVDAGIGEALGKLYVERYYPPEAKARMKEMIDNIKAVMRERLQTLDWMSEPTRQKALEKFDRFQARIGHPDTFRTYQDVNIMRGDFYANVQASTLAEVKRNSAKLGQPVDKSEWSMTPPTVNAYFQPTANQIVFPAGILQPPFFDFTLDDAVNYGAIGAVIGHEITHGFDDQGRRYDADGNLVDWWTEEDGAKFAQRASKLIQQYNAYNPLPGLFVNGALSLGENIADLGGTSIAFEALQRSLKGKPVVWVDGFTPEQRFFLSWAQQWRTQFREDALRRQVAVGPHSPGMYRAIGPITNMAEFFAAFEIKEGDPMWRKPEDRVKIW